MFTAQAFPTDPTQFTAYGVLGLLGVVIAILCAVVFRLFNKQADSMATRDKVLMDFVDKQRGETSATMKDIASTVSTSYDRMSQIFSRQQRSMDEIIMTNRVIDRLERLKGKSTALGEVDIERIVRSVVHEQMGRREG